MAVDETLLASADRSGTPILRFYQWAEPTLSLGYFQDWQSRLEHPASLHCPMVRRLSGGGAILHDRELTYSVAVPSHLLPTRHPSDLYGLIHESLIELFWTWEVKVRRWQCPCQPAQDSGGASVRNEVDAGEKTSPRGEDAWMGAKDAPANPSAGEEMSPPTTPHAGEGWSPPVIPHPGGESPSLSNDSAQEREPFLCFQRRTQWDLVAEGPNGREIKLVGSAQRRTRSAVLQHGSILLGRSPAAPELPGLSELVGQRIEPDKLLSDWILILKERLSWSWELSSLTAQEQAEAEELVHRKYAADSWTLRR